MPYIETILAVISSSAITAIISSIINRRKNRVDIESKIQNMASRLLDDYRVEIDSLRQQMAQLEIEYSNVKRENELLRREIDILKRRDGLFPSSTRGLG